MILQQCGHQHVAVIGDPRLLQELPGIPVLWPQSGGDRVQSAAVEGTACGLDAMPDFAPDYGLAQLSPWRC
jgi:hypothetical protein